MEFGLELAAGVSAAMIGMLALLALVDSTSFGTLLIPTWLLLDDERPRVGRMLAYLGTIAALYFALGLALSAGMRLVLDDLMAWFATESGAVVIVAVGAVLIAGSWALDHRRRRARANGTSGRIARWRARVMAADGSVWPLLTLALTATVLEIATLLPYLAALGILSESQLSLGTHAALVAFYCVVMVIPALVLTLLRLVAHQAVRPVLAKINGWMERSGNETVLWIVTIVGVILVINGIGALGGIDGLFDQVTR